MKEKCMVFSFVFILLLVIKCCFEIFSFLPIKSEKREYEIVTLNDFNMEEVSKQNNLSIYSTFGVLYRQKDNNISFMIKEDGATTLVMLPFEGNITFKEGDKNMISYTQKVDNLKKPLADIPITDITIEYDEAQFNGETTK